MTYKPIQRIEWEYVNYVCIRCTSLIVSQNGIIMQVMLHAMPLKHLISDFSTHEVLFTEILRLVPLHVNFPDQTIRVGN